MPPKTTFTKDDVVRAGLEITRERGMDQLSARKIAERLGSSTAPVYSCYESMESLKNDVLNEAKDLLFAYATRNYTDKPFLNMGVGIVLFAREERELYRILFLANADSREAVDEFVRSMKDELARLPGFSELPKGRRDRLLTRMWIFTHGLASLVCVGHMEIQNAEEAVSFLHEVGMTLAQREFDPETLLPGKEC